MMKRFYLLFILIVCAGFQNVHSQIPNPPDGKEWKTVPVLSDEFNANTLDENKWFDYHPHWAGRPPSKFKKGNAFVEGGYLKLRSTLLKDPSTVNNPLSDIWVNAAACVSKDKSAKPGYYYEARFKASSLSMTSSFWFRVGQFSEIDVIEHIGNPSRDDRQDDLPYEYAANTHYYGPHNGLDNKKATWRMPVRGRDGFHTYGFWWKSPNQLLFYYDGQQVMEIVPRVPLDENLKMIFDTEVFPFAQAGVPNIGLPKVENLNDDSMNTMLVDWVRVYELVNGDGTGTTDEVAFLNAPTTVQSQTSYTFDLAYTASTDRELVAEFWSPTAWIASQIETVPAGESVKTVTVNLPDAPEAGNGYVYKAQIRPLGSTWQDAIDTDQVNNVTIEEALSVEDNDLIDFNFYPNPSNGKVNIKTKNRDVVAIHVYDLYGKKVFSETSDDTVIDLTNLVTGMYLIQVVQDGKKLSKKLLIQ